MPRSGYETLPSIQTGSGARYASSCTEFLRMYTHLEHLRRNQRPSDPLSMVLAPLSEGLKAFQAAAVAVYPVASVADAAVQGELGGTLDRAVSLRGALERAFKLARVPRAGVTEELSQLVSRYPTRCCCDLSVSHVYNPRTDNSLPVPVRRFSQAGNAAHFHALALELFVPADLSPRKKQALDDDLAGLYNAVQVMRAALPSERQLAPTGGA